MSFELLTDVLRWTPRSLLVGSILLLTGFCLRGEASRRPAVGWTLIFIGSILFEVSVAPVPWHPLAPTLVAGSSGVLLLLIGFAGVSSFLAWSTASELKKVEPDIGPVLQYTYLAMVMTGLGIACSVLLIYPTIKVGVAERSRLRDMTASLSIRSESLEQAAVTEAPSNKKIVFGDDDVYYRPELADVLSQLDPCAPALPVQCL